MDNPITLVAYSKAFRRQQEIPVESCSFTPKFNALGIGEISLGVGSSVQKFLTTPGARIVATYRDEHLMSGRIKNPAGTFQPGDLVTYELEDDWRVLENTRAWVNPRGNLEASSLSDIAQAWQTGSVGSPGTTDGQIGYFLWPAAISSAESAIKYLISENLVARLGRPIYVAPNQNRGGDARSAGLLDTPIRFDTLADAIGPILAWSGLGLTVVQKPGEARLTIEVYEPPTWPTTLSLDAGMLTEGTWKQQEAEATRVIVGGPGDDAARIYTQTIDTALEDAYGDVIEVFQDATDVSIPWPSNLVAGLAIAKYARYRLELTDTQRTALFAGLSQAGTAALADLSRKVDLGITLAETPSFHFHGDDGIHVGTLASIKAGALEFDDRLTSAVVAVGDSGLTVTPSLGEISDDEDDELWRAVDALAKSLRKNRTQR